MLRIHDEMPPGSVEGVSAAKRLGYVLRRAGALRNASGVVSSRQTVLWAGVEFEVTRDSGGREWWTGPAAGGVQAAPVLAHTLTRGAGVLLGPAPAAGSDGAVS